MVEYVNKNKKSTAFAEHFGEHFKELGIKDIDQDQVRAGQSNGGRMQGSLGYWRMC